MVTQAIPRVAPKDHEQLAPRTHQRSNLPWDKIAELTAAAPNRLNVLSVIDCFKDSLNGGFDEENDLAFGSWDRKVEFVDEEERCDACSSVSDSGAHIANDFRARRSYITTEQALNDDCYMAIKKALFRSMIAERLSASTEYVSPNSSEAPSTLSSPRGNFEFSGIKSKSDSSDANEEGVLLFWSDEDCYAAICRTFVVKDARSRGFRRRYMLLVLSRNRELLFQNYKPIVAELNTTAHLIQIAASKIYKIEQKFDKTALRQARWMPSEFFKSKIVLDTTRSLSILVGDDDAFFSLHKDFVGLLQRVFAYELQREPNTQCPVDIATKYFEKFLAYQAFIDLKYIQRQLSPENFKLLIWHICVGKQVLVRSDGAVPRKQFLFALSLLLPSECILYEPNSGKYMSGSDANFLGIDRDTEWPKDEDDLFVFTIKSRKLNLSSEVFNARIILTKAPVINKTIRPPIVVQQYWQIFDTNNKNSPQCQFLSLLNAKLSQLENCEMIHETCDTTARQRQFIRILGGSNADFEVYQFWQTAISEKQKISFKLLPVTEEFEEDLSSPGDSENIPRTFLEEEIIEITQKLSQLKLNGSTRKLIHAINGRVNGNTLVK